MSTPRRTETTPFFINRDFSFYWLVRICSMMSFQMLAVAVGWQVYALTHLSLIHI